MWCVCVCVCVCVWCDCRKETFGWIPFVGDYLQQGVDEEQAKVPTKQRSIPQKLNQ